MLHAKPSHNTYIFFLQKTFFLRERSGAKKDCNSFGKAFLSKKRFVLKEKIRECF
jgi:hypothetical protein